MKVTRRELEVIQASLHIVAMDYGHRLEVVRKRAKIADSLDKRIRQFLLDHSLASEFTITAE